jgi:hypothetical protein
MVFRYYDVSTINTRCGYQCGIFSDWAGLEMTSLETRSIRAQDQSVQRSPLAGIKKIDAGRRPVIAGILPSGMRYPPELRSTCLSSPAIAVGRTG